VHEILKYLTSRAVESIKEGLVRPVATFVPSSPGGHLSRPPAAPDS
jgi:hypothetical protein